MRTFKSHCLLMAVISGLLISGCSEDAVINGSADNEEPGLNTGMTLIQAMGNSFIMGSDYGEPNEQPAHTVSFTYNFWMDTTEVTQGDYESLMSIEYPDYSSPDWHNPFGVGDNYPAYAVTWSDAILYCNARSKRDGLDTMYTYSGISGTWGNGCELTDVEIDYSKDGYRLPTEAEWEYACRAGSTTDFFWGKDNTNYPQTSADTTEVNSYAVWCENSWDLSSDDPGFGTHPVASKQPNSFGLYDMAGNSFEWCNDWFGNYSNEIQVDPTGPETGNYHFTRGGSWGNRVSFLRSSSRSFSTPDYFFNFLGFRVVRKDQ